MPLYEYRCGSCSRILEIIQKFSDKPKKKCPECGGPLEKLVSASGFVLKGSGWYASDYKRPASKGSETTKEAPKKDGSGGESGGSGDSKALASVGD